MKSEEIAILRILFKHKTAMKLSNLVEGFPDHSRNHILEAVSTLQRQSFVLLVDYSSILYIYINRQMRRTVSDLVYSNFQEYKDIEEKEERVVLNSNTVKNIKHKQNSSKLITYADGHLGLRLPISAVKATATALIFSAVILGTIFSLGSQTTSTALNGDNIPSVMFTSTSLSPSNIPIRVSIPVDFLSSTTWTPVSSTESVSYQVILLNQDSISSSSAVAPLPYNESPNGPRLYLLESVSPVSGSDTTYSFLILEVDRSNDLSFM